MSKDPSKDLAPIEEILKKPYLNEIETSAITNLAPQTLRNQRHARKGIPYLKVGGRVMYRTVDVQATMEKHRITFNEAEAA